MRDVYDMLDAYGVRYTGVQGDMREYHENVDRSRTWSAVAFQAAGGRITRLRLLSDPGFPMWDISYCHGTLPNGTVVPVDIGTHQIPKRHAMRYLVALAIRDGYNAKRLGLLDTGNWSTLN